MTEYVVKVSAAKMPSSVSAPYMHVALMEVDEGTFPTMISERARGVRRIVKVWRRLHAKGNKTAYYYALLEATSMCDQLNQEHRQ